MNPDSHTNENIPGNLRVSREGDLLVLSTRLATIRIPAKRAQEIVKAIQEVSS